MLKVGDLIVYRCFASSPCIFEILGVNHDFLRVKNIYKGCFDTASCGTISYYNKAVSSGRIKVLLRCKLGHKVKVEVKKK